MTTRRRFFVITPHPSDGRLRRWCEWLGAAVLAGSPAEVCRRVVRERPLALLCWGASPDAVALIGLLARVPVRVRILDESDRGGGVLARTYHLTIAPSQPDARAFLASCRGCRADRVAVLGQDVDDEKRALEALLREPISLFSGRRWSM